MMMSRTQRKAKSWAAVLGAGAAAMGLLFACSGGGDDTVAGKVNPTGGGGGPDGSSSDATTAPDTLRPLGAAICTKYPNGPALAAKVTADLLTRVSADCRISAYFAAPKSGTAHLSQCLEQQVSTFFQCPGATYGADKAGVACRTMQEAHRDLHLRKSDFDAYIESVIAALKGSGISDDDITVVLLTFTGTETAIVPNLKTKSYSNCSCPNELIPDGGGYCGPDAGYDGGDGGEGGSDAGASDAADGGG